MTLDENMINIVVCEIDIEEVYGYGGSFENVRMDVIVSTDSCLAAFKPFNFLTALILNPHCQYFFIFVFYFAFSSSEPEIGRNCRRSRSRSRSPFPFPGSAGGWTS